MKSTYSTSQIAKIIGIHPNTVRLYEDIGFITTPIRKSNGYRIFTDLHIDQFRLARLALEVEVLQNGLNLQINRGEVFGLLGANGAGKSTAIECILGTKTVDSGKVSILGLTPKHHRKQLFERVGVQFQSTNYPDKIKVGELCEETMYLYKTFTDYHELLKQFGLADKENAFISELSGGQKQRLFIVLALIPNPEVVFMDELTTGLDPKARRDVWHCLTKLKANGLTILLSSHFMDEVEAIPSLNSPLVQ